MLGYGLVLLGGLVISVVPESSWAGRSDLLEALRGTTAGRMLGLAVVVAGLALASVAWLSLVSATRSPEHGEAARLGAVRRATAVWVLPLLLAPPMFSRDGWSYAAQGVMTELGVSPYVWTPSILDGPVVEAVDPRWMTTLTPYGPIPLVWGALAAGVTHDPWALVVAHRLLALAGVALLAWALPRLARWSGRDPAVVCALVLPSPLMMAHGVAGLHNDVLMVGVMAAALVIAAERRGWLLAAGLAGLAAAVKLPAGAVGLGVALASVPRNATLPTLVRRLLGVGLVAVGTLVAVGLLTGLGVGWLHALGVPGTVRTPLSLPTQLGRLGNLLGSLVLPGSGVDLVPLVRGLGTAAALVAAVVLTLRAPRGVPGAAVRAVALAMLWVVVLSPVVHHWYVLWFLPLLAVCRPGRRTEAALLHVGWLGGMLAPLDSSLAGAGSVIAGAVALVTVGSLIQVRVIRRSGAPTRPRDPRAA